MILAVASYHWMNNWENNNKSEYNKLKNMVLETLIRRASEIIPDLPNIIEFEDIATPLTFERYTHNSSGSTNAWSWNPKEKFYKTPISTNVFTPIKNLLIGSSWATQIGSVPYAIKAAKKCVRVIGG